MPYFQKHLKSFIQTPNFQNVTDIYSLIWIIIVIVKNGKQL